MSQRTLRDDLRDHYQAQELSPGALARLTAMAETAEPSRRRRGGKATWLALAATIALLVAMVLLWLWNVPRSTVESQLASSVAGEIAMNHNKALAVEFQSNNLAELRSMMGKLDFSLVEASRLENRNLRLLGARYCSIQGNLAAQLRLETRDGQVMTLYQTPVVAGLGSLHDSELQARGLHIDLWQEEGIFFGLARSAEPEPKS